MTHDLKISKEYYQDVLLRFKTFELRRNDRDYKVGDILLLNEYDINDLKYTGRKLKRVITYILKGGNYGLDENFVIMGIKRL